MSRSRSCRPSAPGPLSDKRTLQSLAFALTFAGIILGHAHGGRQFTHSFHGSFASWLLLPILAQLSLGVYLKLHIHEETVRPYAVRAHGILGRIWPILGWVQGLFGVVVLRGFCGEVGAGQCAAHYIMVRRRLGLRSQVYAAHSALGECIYWLRDNYGHFARCR